MPKSFCLDTFFTATFLINKTPSKLLAFKTPYEVLFQNAPDLSILTVYGCACFPFLGHSRKDILSPKSSPCTFIGCRHLHKGYRCYEMSSNKLFISIHVIFDELCFSFCTCTSSVTPSPTSTMTLPIPIFH